MFKVQSSKFQVENIKYKTLNLEPGTQNVELRLKLQVSELASCFGCHSRVHGNPETQIEEILHLKPWIPTVVYPHESGGGNDEQVRFPLPA